VSGPGLGADRPWGQLIEDFCEVVLALRPRADVELLGHACNVAAWCHQGQKRLSGHPYITHPVAVAMILAGLEETAEVDDQTLCAAVLHDTVEDTSYTLAALKRDFGTAVATMVTQHMALDRLGRQQGRTASQTLAAIGSADTRVLAMKMADRLRNMQTLQCLPQVTQQRKAREVLDTYLPVADQLRLHTVRSELLALACAALIRSQPPSPSRDRVIVALDIERSTTRPDRVKRDLRTMLYELFDAALRSAGVDADRHDRFIDRGDGLLALIDPADQAVVLTRVVPVFSQLLTGYNARFADSGEGQRELRVRVVLHCGEINDDDNGPFGETLDTAFRLLDAPRVKAALAAAPQPLLLVVSGEVYETAVRYDPSETGQPAFRGLVTAEVAGRHHQGWIHIPAAAGGGQPNPSTTATPAERTSSHIPDAAITRRYDR
jgi:HD domain-containing protein